jgi:dolichol-phosphate mannosyltransferase
MNKVSVVIPTYNEKENILELVSEIVGIFKSKKIIYEIIVVDDDSPDKGGYVAKKKFAKNKNVKIYIRKKDKGLSKSIRYGIKKATGSVLVGMDSDFNHPPKDILRLVAKIGKFDLVVAQRRAMEGNLRYPFTYIFNLFLKYILGFPTMDNMSGFYAVKKDTLNKLNFDHVYRGFGEYHLRMLIGIKRAGGKITEVPFISPDRKYGVSKSNLLKMFINYIAISVKLALNIGNEKV